MLEAVIIATIMLSAVAFVATFEQPPTSTTTTRPILERAAQDALSILYDTPVNSTLGDNLLSVDLAKCLQGSCSDLSQKLDGLMPIGSSYALYISNGYDTFPVYVTKSPPGEAVTARQLMEPRWSYTFTASAMANVNNGTDAALIYSLPVFNSNVVSPGGSPLKVIVSGTRSSDQADYVLEGFATTQAVATTDAQKVPALSMNFLVNKTVWETGPGTQLPSNGVDSYYPGAVWDRYYETIDQNTGAPTLNAIPFRIHLANTGQAQVPAGTEITVDVPRGWSATGVDDANWAVIKDATDWNATYNASQVVAQLKVPIDPNGVNGPSALDFTFNGVYHGDMLKYYDFHASLAKGANAEANVVVIADGWGDQSQTYYAPSVKMSVPRPMGATATTTWSLGVVIPYSAGNSLDVSKAGITHQNQAQVSVNPYLTTNVNDPPAKAPDYDVTAGSSILINKIQIIEQDGAKIFGNVQPIQVANDATDGHLNEGGPGAWSVANGGSELDWTGLHDSQYGPLNLTFTVTGSGVAGDPAGPQAIVPPVDFDIWQGRMVDTVSPGLYRQTVLPNGTGGQGYSTLYEGYNTSPVNAHTPFDHGYTSSPAYRGLSLPGNGSYSADPLSPVHDSIYGSYVNVEKRTVPIGGQVVVTADVQSLLYALSEAGENAGVNLTFYPPWTGPDHTPIWSQSNLESSVVTSSYKAMTMVDVNRDGYPDPVMGTDQGRVFGLDALNGKHLQGNTWTAPVLSGNALVAAIDALAPLRVGSDDYIVVGADASSGVYVIDRSFNTTWSWNKALYDASDVVAIDTSTDFNGDGQNDIAVALADSTVWILTPGPGGLLTLLPAGTTIQAYSSQGTPTAFATASSLGPQHEKGFVLSLLNKPGPASKVTVTSSDPTQSLQNPPQFFVNLPRAGLDAANGNGQLLWRFGAGPINVARPYGDLNGDGSTDIVAGSSAGFVTLLDGAKGVPPMSGVIITGISKILDGKSPTIQDSAFVTLDGSVYFTHDRWNTAFCIGCDPSGQVTHVDNRLQGVSLNMSGSAWMVGSGGAMYKTGDVIVTDPVSGNPVNVAGQKEAFPVTPGVTAVDVPGQAPVNVPYLPIDYHDVYFRFGTQAWNGLTHKGDEGWVVGSPPSSCTYTGDLTNICNEAVVMHTWNGGQSWTQLTSKDSTNSLYAADGHSPVTSSLTRINFTTDQLGWIVGNAGTLLRTTNGGTSFTGLKIMGSGQGTTTDVTDISCVPDGAGDYTCMISGVGGFLWKLTQASQSSIADNQWTNLTQYLAPTGKDIKGLGMVNTQIAYAAASNAVLGTWNGGLNWSALPMGYVPGDATRLNLFPDGTGYGWGGNATNAEQFIFSQYRGNATWQTVDLTPSATSFTTDTNPLIDRVDITAQASTTNSAQLQWNVSADGGQTWTPAPIGTAPAVQSVPEAAGVSLDVAQNYYEADIPAARQGHDLVLRATWNTTQDIGLQTAQVTGSIGLVVNFTSTQHPSNQTVPLPDVNLSVDPQTDTTPGVSSIVWDQALSQLHAPLATKFWTTNVSGSVLDVQTGYDVTHDGTNDVWASTGNVLSSSSPDYIAYAGTNEAQVVATNDRVVLLDGKDGHIVRTSDQLGGDVKEIRLADEDGDGWPDTLFAVTYNAQSSTTTVYAFDAANLTRLPGDDRGPWIYPVGTATPVGLEVGKATATRYHAYVPVNIVANTTGTTITSILYALNSATTRASDWSSPSDARGTYSITKQIPTNWFFGPYVVEIRVDWRDRVTSQDTGQAIPYDVLQSARFYDYFMVTPPNALAPASPVYDVQLVSWFDDWR